MSLLEQLSVVRALEREAEQQLAALAIIKRRLEIERLRGLEIIAKATVPAPLEKGLARS